MEAAVRTALALTDDIRLQARAYGLLGVALVDKPERTAEDLDEAEQAFRQVIALVGDESPSPAHYSLAKVLQESGEVAEAAALAKVIFEESPEGPLERPSYEQRPLGGDGNVRHPKTTFTAKEPPCSIASKFPMTSPSA